MMDMFELLAEKQLEKNAPLAERMKPETLAEFYGQEAIVGQGKLLTKMIETDRLGSLLLYGPPGSGKTSLAKIVANTTKATFVSLNAVTAGVKDIRATVDKAMDDLAMYHKKTVLFVDEIHRFNKAQQDALLPYVENGTVVLIGATTENPYFEVNSALLSRSTVFRLETLNINVLMDIMKRALADERKGLGIYDIHISEETLEYIAHMSSGDARRALNILEMAVLSKLGLEETIEISITDIQESLQMKSSLYDKGGDHHYDIVSAFIKSMRGSDPDAALFYLGKMIYSGEDPKFIARRIIICASEDVGNADPMALVVANNAAQALNFIGMPEGRIVLAQAVTYVATAPKSNASYLGINQVLNDIETEDTGSVPYNLRDGTSLKLERKYTGDESSEPYKYPHDYTHGYVPQQYLPSAIKNKRYYLPKQIGYENNIARYLSETKFKKK